MGLVLLLVSCSQNGIEKTANEHDFCTLSNSAANAVALACPNVYEAPPGDNGADDYHDRPAFEVWAYLVHTWSDQQESFLDAMATCSFDADYFPSDVDSAEYGLANAEQCVDLKACLDDHGITFPSEWPTTSYFDSLPVEGETCGLDDLSSSDTE